MKNSFSQYLITVLAGEQIKLLEPMPLFKRKLVCVESERIIILYMYVVLTGCNDFVRK